MTNLIKFSDEIKTVAMDTRQGNGARVLRAKEFRDIYKVEFPESTRKEQKQAYARYYRKAINANVQDLAAMLATGRFGVEQATTKGAKTKVILVDKEALTESVATPQSLDEIVQGMDADAIKSLIERLQKKVA